MAVQNNVLGHQKYVWLTTTDNSRVIAKCETCVRERERCKCRQRPKIANNYKVRRAGWRISIGQRILHSEDE